MKTGTNGKNRTNRQKLVTLPVMETEKARAKAKQYIWSKMGDWLMDVAKYFVTTILVSSIFHRNQGKNTMDSLFFCIGYGYGNPVIWRIYK